MVNQRYLAGLCAEPGHGVVEAATICIRGSGASMRVDKCTGCALPCSLPLMASAVGPTSRLHDPRSLISLSRALGQLLVEALRQATDRAEWSWHEILCAGLLEPYLVLEPQEHGAFAVPLPLASLLSELTGLSVAHGFGLRDFAAGGQGAPVSGAPEWILFHCESEDRLVLHLGDIFWVHWLPRNGSWQQMRGAIIGPGLAWLAGLTLALTAGREPGDRSGHLAVQGRLIRDLLVRWQAHPALLRRNTRGFSLSAFGLDWTQATVQLARQRGWHGLDVLCTAHHWLAQLVAEAVYRLIGDARPTRVLVTGCGHRNGFLWQLLQERFPASTLERSDAYGVPAETAQAVRAAVLAGLLLDQVPANVPQITGSSGPRLLGSWSPGSLSNWSRCLHWMTAGTDPLLWEER